MLLGKQRSGKLYTEELRRIRAYRNPDFLQKMVEFFGIQDQGTCFPKDIFDPSSLPKSDFYTECVASHNYLGPYMCFRSCSAPLTACSTKRADEIELSSCRHVCNLHTKRVSPGNDGS